MEYIIAAVPWIANALILWGGWQVGKKNRNAFFYYIAGELTWVWYAIVYEHLWSLAVVCVAFAAMSLRNWVKWGSAVDYEKVLKVYATLIRDKDRDYHGPDTPELTKHERKYLQAFLRENNF